MTMERTFIMGFFKALFGDHHQEDLTPVTLEEFYTWMDDVIGLTRLPNNDSMKFAVSTIVLEAKELLTKKSAALKLEKGAQNQFASFVFQDIKSKHIAKEQEAAAALAQALPPEAAPLSTEAPLETPPQVVPSDENKEPGVSSPSEVLV
jgi:hypothetical protein